MRSPRSETVAHVRFTYAAHSSCLLWANTGLPLLIRSSRPARACSAAGTLRPSALADLRLIYKFDFRGPLDWQLARLFAFEKTSGVDAG